MSSGERRKALSAVPTGLYEPRCLAVVRCRCFGWASSGASRGSVDPYLRTSTPKTGAPRLGLLAQPLELAAAVLVGEGGGAGEPQFDEVLVEEVLVLPVAVRIDNLNRSR